MCVKIVYFAPFIFPAAVQWTPSVGPTKKVTQSRTCHRPRRVSRYGATLTPHSHGGPEVSGGRQGDQAAAVEDLLMHRPALSQNICQSCAPRRVVLPWSIIQVAQSPEASYFSCARQKALKSAAQQKPGDKFERPRGAPGISTVSISDSRDLRICVRRSRESERWS